jgi:hypothetical protein
MSLERIEKSNTDPVLLLLDGQKGLDYTYFLNYEPGNLKRFQRFYKRVNNKDEFLTTLKKFGENVGIDFLIVTPQHGCEESIQFSDGSELTDADIL